MTLRNVAFGSVVACATLTAPVTPGPDAGRTATGTHRVIEGRLLGYGYLPLANVEKDRQPDIPVAAVHVLLAARSEDGPRPPLEAQAAARLMLGEIDAAIESLEDVPGPQRTAPMLTVLSAAYLERARRGDVVEAAAAAVDAAERAIQIDQTSIEASFNRAAALDRLGLGATAEAWSAYLEKDANSGWAKEAAALRAAAAPPPGLDEWSRLLRSRSATREIGAIDLAGMTAIQGDRARELIEDTLLVDWARAVLAGETARQVRSLQAARDVAEALAERLEDRTMVDLVSEIRDVQPRRLATVARGLLDAHEARSAIDRGEVDRATPYLARARTLVADLRTAGEVVDLYADFFSYYQADYARAQSSLLKLTARATARRHFYVAGRARFILAAIAARRANFSEAERLYSEAIRLFTAAGEISYLASAHAIVATLRREQGDDRMAWEYLRQALIRLPLISNPRHVYSILNSAMAVALGADLPGLAVHFARLLVSTARGWNNPVALVSALSDEAQQLARFGQSGAAQQRMNEAHASLNLVSEQIRPVSAAQLARAGARIVAETQPCDAVRSYSAAIETTQHVAPYQMAKLHLGRALAHRACGSLDGAEQDLRAGIRIFEAQRSRQRETVLQISHFDEVWDLYGQLVRLLAVERGAIEPALEIAERSRARALSEALGAEPSRASVAAVRAALDRRTTVLSYIALDDEVLVWAVTRDMIQFRRLGVRSDDVRLAVQRWRTTVQSAEDDKPLASRLFDMLLRPVETWLVDDGQLIIVGDGSLHGLAFGALWDGRRYLVERTTVWTTPSLQLLWSALRAERGSASTRARILAVGDPAFPSASFPRLPRLPGAAREATDTASLYVTHTTLVGRAATRSAILAGLRIADVVHIAAHAVPDLVDPESSFIVVAADGSREDAILTAKDISGLGQLPTRLVILSACQTASGRVVRGEGVLSLARAFIGAGIPTIMGNLWDVSDSSSYSLHLRLHEAWARGYTAAAALRTAQLQLLRGSSLAERKPGVWAAMVGLGSPNTVVKATSTGSN